MVFAHADDETLLAGALIAKLVSIGHEVNVLCLAPGGWERTQRLRNACKVLGVSAVETLRYAGGVMWPDESVMYELKTHGARQSKKRLRKKGDDDQTLTPVIATAPEGDLAARIGGRMSEYGPDIVFTHSRYGDYGHPDHAATYRATVLAFKSSGGDCARLYAIAWPSLLVNLNSRLMKISGRDISRMGPDGRFDFPVAIRAHSTDGASIAIDVAGMLGTRRAASRWYADEISRGPLPLRVLERLPIWLQKKVLGRARLTLLRAPEGFSPGALHRGGASSGEYL